MSDLTQEDQDLEDDDDSFPLENNDDEWNEDEDGPGEDIPPPDDEPEAQQQSPAGVANVQTATRNQQPTYAPPPIPRFEMTQEQEAAFNQALLGENPATVIKSLVETIVGTHVQAAQIVSSSADASAHRLATKHPRLYAQYGDRIRSILAQAPPETKNNPLAAEWAVLTELSQEVGKTGDLREMKRITDLLDFPDEEQPTRNKQQQQQPIQRQQQSQRTQQTQARPIPTAQRPPAPTSGVRGGAISPQRQAQQRSPASFTELIFGHMGVRRDTAKAAAAAAVEEE